MIERADMLSSIVAACPGFASAYEAFLAEWQDSSEAPVYLALADFARHLITLLEANDQQQLRAAFEVIERFHIEGDDYVREAATIGILESLQNANLHTRTTPDQFLEYLLPVSLRYWHKVDDFWTNGKIITED